jgi:hypothetical protein
MLANTIDSFRISNNRNRSRTPWAPVQVFFPFRVVLRPEPLPSGTRAGHIHIHLPEPDNILCPKRLELDNLGSVPSVDGEKPTKVIGIYPLYGYRTPFGTFLELWVQSREDLIWL